MKKITTLLLLSTLLLSSCTRTVAPDSNMNYTISQLSASAQMGKSSSSKKSIEQQKVKKPDSPETIFKTLTGTHRKRATKEDKKTALYLEEQLKAQGYLTEIQEYPIYTVSLERYMEDKKNLKPKNSVFFGDSFNVIAEKKVDPTKKILIFSAHYDTTTDSLGALDNAAGVTALLTAAGEIFKDDLPYNIRIIFFGSEEYRLYGSRSYLAALTKEERENIAGCFNIDMLGHLTTRKLIVETATGKHNKLSKEFFRLNKDLTLREGSYSDDASFANYEIPALRFTTVDSRSKKFDPKLLSVETSTDTVSMKLLKEDIKTIREFMQNVDGKNL